MNCLLRIHLSGVILALAIPGAWAAESERAPGSSAVVRLDVTRDAWVSDVGAETNGNNGGAPRLKLKSIQEMSLVDFDLKPLLGHTIRSAVLHLKKAGDEPLRRVTVSGVGAEWFEGTGSGYAIERGGVTFRHRRHPDLAWSLDGGDLTHVVLGNGGTTWRMADASAADADGWQHVPVDPRVVAMRLAGLSHGFLVFDDTGTEWTRAGEQFTLKPFPNRFLYSREQNRASAPYLTIEPGPTDHQPPATPTAARIEPDTSRLPPGEAIVSWITPRDSGPANTIGFAITLDGRALPRELIPLAGEPGGRVEMHLRDLETPAAATVKLSIKAVDGAGSVSAPLVVDVNVSSFIPARLPESSKFPPRSSADRANRSGARSPSLPRLGNLEVAIIDELDKVHLKSGALIPDEPPDYLAANHLWNAAEPRITLQAARNEFVSFQILLRGTSPFVAPSVQLDLVFDEPAGRSLQVSIGRYHPVPTRIGAIPDPIVPVNNPAASVSTGKTQSLHVEIYVPHGVSAGRHRGTLTLRGRAPARALVVPVLLDVWDFDLPDHLSFLPEMNCYGLPDNERDYYRLAHRHRTILNRVPYSQRGEIAEGCAPRWDQVRGQLDWTAWDRRFGPLLDGSAFADLPRKGVPIECFYLPLHENWPSPMDGNYNGSYWADHSFPDSYRRAFVGATKQIASHLQSRGFGDTLFQGFLNNKVDFKTKGWSRGSSPWLLDEPANFQDYWALYYFARAFHEGINRALRSPVAPRSGGSTSVPSSKPRLVFRADISRPQWRRDVLDGLLDYLVVGSAMRAYPRLVFERKRVLGEIVLEYGSTNPIEGSNFQPVGWCLDTWSLGADGVIPWQTVGNDGSWDQADELALFYPGRRTSNETGARANLAPAPVPSVRLKAYRRGQQDVEYLALWSSLNDQPRWAVGRQMRAALKLTGQREATGTDAVEDAGRIDYAQLRPGDLWAIRTAIAAALSQAHPAPRTKLVDFRTPRRNADYVRPTYVGADGTP